MALRDLTNMKSFYFFIIILSFLNSLSYSQTKLLQSENKLEFLTLNKDTITISASNNYYTRFYFNNNLIYDDTISSYILASNLNRVIEGKKGIALFLVIDGRPNFNKILGFQIAQTKAILKSNACFFGEGGRKDGPAPFTDMNGNGYLDYGGFDITEVPPSYPDSIYYNPGDFYEIRDGEIIYDKKLTKEMDIKENGIYLDKPLDKDGFCCVVIPNPKKK